MDRTRGSTGLLRHRQRKDCRARWRRRQRVAADAGVLRRRRRCRQPRIAVTHARPHRPQQFRAAPWIRLPALRRRRDGHSRRLRPLLRHDADRYLGLPRAIRVSGDRVHQPGGPDRGAADRVSRGRHRGTGNHRAAARGQSGSAASVQPSVERHDRARAVENRLPFVLCRHAGTRDVVHARRQRAGG